MGYFDTDHIVVPEITAGASAGFFENVRQGYEQQFRVDSPFALREELDNRWRESLRLLEVQTGERYSADSYKGVLEEYAAGQVEGVPLTNWGNLTPTEVEARQRQLEQFRLADGRIKAIGDPNLKSFRQVLEDTVRAQQAIEAKTGDFSERSGIVGTLGHLVGAIGGSFSLRDPLTLFSTPFGGFGRGALMKIATEMGVVGLASTPGAIEVAENRDFAKLPERSPVFDIAAAAIGAGLLRGAFEGGGAVLSRLRKAEDVRLDFEDTQLRSIFEARPESPRARAALEILDDHAALRAASPYGDSDQGLARFTAELTDVARVLGGQPDTAIVRVLPEMPFEYIEKNLDFELVRAEAPEVYGRLETVRAALDEVDGRVAELETALQQPPLIQALEAIDEATGGLVRSFEEDLNNPQLTARQRSDIERQINTIVESIGPETIARTAQDMQIGPRKELRAVRKTRRQVNARYKAAYKAVENEVGKIKTRQAILRGTRPEPAPTVLDYTPVLGDFMQYDRVAARAADIEAASEIQDDAARRILASPEPSEGLVDIGLSERVSGDLTFPTEGGEMSFRQALADLREDEALEEAMRVCSL